MKKVIVIVGPTGIGKTNLSIKLAKALSAEIINGDSVSVYKDLNIGSAKIKESEMDGIKHHLVSYLDCSKQFSVFDFQKLSRELIEEIKTPMIVGGTGLYIKAALYDYRFDAPKRDDEFELKYQNYSNDELYDLLLKADENIKNIHKNNRKRVLRALEVALSDNLISENINKNIECYRNYIIYLDMPREKLYERINQRVDEMFNEGLLTEVKNLHKQGHMINAIGYKEFIPYFKNEITLDEVKEEIKKNSRHLAKKQITWFKHQMNANFYNVETDCFDEVLKDVQKFLEE